MGDRDAGGTARVALVDDEEDVLTFLSMVLEDAGFSTLAISRPLEAIQRLRAFAPHAICLDLLMPEQMGPSLYAEIRHDAALATVPVIILTGIAAREDVGRTLTREGTLPAPDEFLEKPVDLDQLVRAVRHAVAPSGGPTP